MVDGNRADRAVPAGPSSGETSCVASISAASILAKTARDAMLDELDVAHPLYGFGHDKGYATQDHLAALARHGPCAAHRKSSWPVVQPSLVY